MGTLRAGDLVFTLSRSVRKSVGLTIRKDGSVHVRAPFWLPVTEIKRMVSQKASWIRSRQQALRNEQVMPAPGPELNRIKKQAELKFRSIAVPWEEHFRIRYGVAPKRWTIREMNTRWGSCSAATGRITLNLKLYYKSDACIEYIVVHELCHLIHANHGKDFYALLERELPDWKTRRKQLKS